MYEMQGTGSHAQGAYPTEDTSHMETEKEKQQEETGTRIIANKKYDIWMKGTWVLKGEMS